MCDLEHSISFAEFAEPDRRGYGYTNYQYSGWFQDVQLERRLEGKWLFCTWLKLEESKETDLKRVEEDAEIKAQEA